MAKAKTLLRRKQSSAKTQKYRLKKGAKVTRHDPTKALLDEKLIAQAFWECLKDNDLEGAIDMIEAHLYALNKTQFSKDSHIPRSTIYKAIRGGNPTLKTVARLIHCSSE